MLNGRNVLIVEDNALIALELESMAADMNSGTIIMALNDGADPLRSIEHLPIGLAILDFRSLARVKAPLSDRLVQSGVPIVFLTTEPAVDEHTGPRRLSVIISKPFSAEDLATAVSTLIG